ncbi:MAG: hypothetical protein NT151_09950 [Acidobacteria bacterium]|nr:hypothetical protein [Acidobacteriota bacterium]
MPTVRSYQRQVGLAPLPGARLTAAETPESEGAGVALAKGKLDVATAQGAEVKALGQAQTFGAIAGVAGKVANIGASVYADIVAKARKEANETALLGAKNQLDAWKSAALYDEQKGALRVKGADALGLHEKVMSAFNQTADAIGGKLTPEQRPYFENLRSQEWSRIDLEVQQHAERETELVKTGEVATFQTNRVIEAVHYAANPKVFRASLDAGLASVDANASLFRMGPEQVAARKLEMTTAAHIGAIHNLVAQDQDSLAATWFTAAKDEIAPDKWDELQTKITEATTTQTAQRESDRIIASDLDIDGQRAEAKKLDGKVRDMTLQYVEHDWNVKKTKEHDQAAAQSLDAYNALEASGWNLRVAHHLPYWTQLDPGVRNMLEEKAARKAKGETTQTDRRTYDALMNLADNNPDGFIREDLLKYRLDETDYKHLASIRSSIKAGNRQAADKELTPFLTRQEVVDATLRQFGVNPKAKEDTPEAKAIAQLHLMVDRRVSAMQTPAVDKATGAALPGKKASNQDIQSIVDNILSQKATVPGSWWGIFGSATRPLLDVSIGDITPDEKKALSDALVARGKRPSDAAILDFYKEFKQRHPNEPIVAAPLPKVPAPKAAPAPTTTQAPGGGAIDWLKGTAKDAAGAVVGAGQAAWEGIDAGDRVAAAAVKKNAERKAAEDKKKAEAKKSGGKQ